MTETVTAEPEPEVAAARVALDGLPPGWVSPEFVAAILRRASAQATGRALARKLTDASARVDASLAAVRAGNVSEGVLAGLVAGRGWLAALEHAASVLPVPSIDVGVCVAVLDVAWGDLVRSAPTAPVRPDYLAEMESWRGHVVPFSNIDPPQPTDADRAAAVSWADADGRVAIWRGGADAWQRDRASTADVLAMLGAAAGYIDMAAEIALVVEAADASTSAANTARLAAGLTWLVPA